ncbi:TlpA family protein disulfide reductase [Symmachiella macrocystis]|nr:TlpA disulfide reductase family protein [Symmachiella macrocystis]
MDNDPFANHDVTVHSSEVVTVQAGAKSDTRRTKRNPNRRNTEPMPANPTRGYGMVGERNTARSSKTSNPESLPRVKPKPEHPIVALIGESAPNINVPIAGGGQVNLVSHQSSEVLVIVLWASYNHLCQDELPALKAAVERYSEEQVQLLAINDGEGIVTIKKYLERNNLELKVGIDMKQEVADAFLVRQLPFVAIIDNEGIVQGIHVGYIDSLGDDISKDLESLVSGKSIIEKSKERLSRQKLSLRSPAPSMLNQRSLVKHQ